MTATRGTPAGPELVLTGERTLPGIPHENYWFRRHEIAYRSALPFVRGAVVLEAGCGEGYGADYLAPHVATMLAVDADPTTVGHVARRYSAVNVVRGDLQRLPVADASVEAVVCLQVIEHLWDQQGFLAECARVLRPAGTLVVSTPNRLTFTPGRDTPLNPFHTRELSAGELTELLAERFEVTRMYGVVHGRRLRRAERRLGPLVQAQLAAPYDAWTPALRRTVTRVRAEDFDVREDDVDASLDLFAVAVRRP